MRPCALGVHTHAPDGAAPRLDDPQLWLHAGFRHQSHTRHLVRHYSDQFLSDMLWCLVIYAVIAPDAITTATAVLRAAKRKCGTCDVPRAKRQEQGVRLLEPLRRWIQVEIL